MDPWRGYSLGTKIGSVIGWCAGEGASEEVELVCMKNLSAQLVEANNQGLFKSPFRQFGPETGYAQIGGGYWPGALCCSRDRCVVRKHSKETITILGPIKHRQTGGSSLKQHFPTNFEKRWHDDPQ